jgi:hypothetical protein
MGYRHFFIFVLVASIPSVIAAWKAPFPDPPDVDEDETSGGKAKTVVALDPAAGLPPETG